MCHGRVPSERRHHPTLWRVRVPHRRLNSDVTWSLSGHWGWGWGWSGGFQHHTQHPGSCQCTRVSPTFFIYIYIYVNKSKRTFSVSHHGFLQLGLNSLINLVRSWKRIHICGCPCINKILLGGFFRSLGFSYICLGVAALHRFPIGRASLSVFLCLPDRRSVWGFVWILIATFFQTWDGSVPGTHGTGNGEEREESTRAEIFLC